VSEAYQVLSDLQKRAQYDRFGHAGVRAGGFARDFEGFDIFGGFGDIFDSFFGDFTGRTRAGPVQGADLHHEVTLTLEEAAFGAEQVVEVQRAEFCERCGGSGAEPGTSPVTCPTCGGTGRVRRSERRLFGAFTQVAVCPACKGRGEVISSPCNRCHGTGRERRKRKVEVRIPSGVEDGTRVRLTGEGDAGAYGGTPGNLYISVHVARHELFQREGTTLLHELSINYAQAALGDEVEAPTLTGTTKVRIPAGTQPGATFRVKGEGVPELHGRRRGDLLVRVNLVVPTSLDAEERELVEELGRRLGKGDGRGGEKGFFERVKDSFGGKT
jgi:molecular chaperone DnaJ